MYLFRCVTSFNVQHKSLENRIHNINIHTIYPSTQLHCTLFTCTRTSIDCAVHCALTVLLCLQCVCVCVVAFCIKMCRYIETLVKNKRTSDWCAMFFKRTSYYPFSARFLKRRTMIVSNMYTIKRSTGIIRMINWKVV